MKLDYSLDYIATVNDFLKWRYAYLGGRNFINNFLKKLSKRETDEDFIDRKAITYCPAFSKVCINEIRNAIYDRMATIIRQGGSPSYQRSILGQDGGVDLCGSTMNYFIGLKILPELLVMGKVGICVDMPKIEGEVSIRDAGRPYLYYYTREQIYNYTKDCNGILDSVTLQNSEGFVLKYEMESGKVLVTKFEKDPDNKTTDPIYRQFEQQVLNLERIPFTICEISHSLMEDVADYQVALMNLCSSDVNFAIRANFPLYVEQYAGQVDAQKPVQDITVGTTKGRRIPAGVEFPQFVAPPAECLKVSIDKQEQIKKEIRQLLNLSLSSLTTARKSAESKQEDSSKEETGLSYIGLELEATERNVVDFWQAFENRKDKFYVKYPEKYALRPREDVLAEIKELTEQTKMINSPTFRKELSKKVVSDLFENSLSPETLAKIKQEIDQAEVVIADPETIIADVEAGLCSTVYASKIRGYPDGEAEKAKEEHADRLARIAQAQSDAKISDQKTSNDPSNKQVRDQQSSNSDNTRGAGK